MKAHHFASGVLLLSSIAFGLEPCPDGACDRQIIGRLLEINDYKFASYEEYANRIRTNSSGRITFVNLSVCTWVRKLPDDFGRLSQLKYLNLSGTSITILPRSIQELKHLKTLDLSGNHLPNCYRLIPHLPQLETVYLIRTGITRLPKRLRQLPSLRVLAVGRNQIRNLPNDLFELKRVKYLGLEENRIKRISPKIGGMEKLNTLDVRSNRLGSIPTSIAKLDTLEEFWCSDNRIRELPFDALMQKNKLRIFHFGRNRICHISPEIRVWVDEMKARRVTELEELGAMPDEPASWTDPQVCGE